MLRPATIHHTKQPVLPASSKVHVQRSTVVEMVVTLYSPYITPLPLAEDGTAFTNL